MRKFALALMLVTGACSFTGSDQTPDPVLTAPAGPATTVAPVAGQLVLAPNGLGVVAFGADVETAIAAVETALGIPFAEDSGWVDPFTKFGTCPGTEARFVEFGDLVLLFTDAATDFAAAGTGHFFAFNYKAGSRGPDGLETAEGIGIGSTAAEVQQTYGASFEFNPLNDGPGGPGFDIGFEIGSFSRLYGSFGGPSPDDIVLVLNGGVGCAE